MLISQDESFRHFLQFNRRWTSIFGLDPLVYLVLESLDETKYCPRRSTGPSTIMVDNIEYNH